MYYINPEKLVNFTPVSNDFIDRYVGNIESTYIAVYIYIARRSLKGKLPTVSELSDRFALGSDVIEKIITYWDREGLFDKPAKPSYSPSEIAKMQRADNEIAELISTASAILGKALGQKEQSTILSLYDYYHLPIEVITILLGHCAEVGNSSINYIEKIAQDWSEKNIKTMEEAEDYLKLYYGDFKKVLAAFGISGRLANSSEKKYIEKWRTVNKQSLELIVEACEQSVINTGKVSWKYADKTLENWLENNIKTVEQAKKFSEEHAAMLKKKKPAKTSSVPEKPVRKTTAFSNFDEREYDEDAINDLVFELLEDDEDEP